MSTDQRRSSMPTEDASDSLSSKGNAVMLGISATRDGGQSET